MSKGFALVLVLVFLTTTCCITTLLPVKAEARTIVVPDNYPTITAAIGNATNGDTILVRSGTYNEQSLETNKTISLIGESSASTVVDLKPPSLPVYILGQYTGNVATAIEFDANNVVISGLTINSYGGMSVTGNHAIIMGNTINDYAQYWFTVMGNYETISNNTSNTVISVECSYSIVSANSGTGSITVSNFGSFNSVFDNSMKGVGGADESSSNLYYGNIVNGGGGMYASVGDIVANNTITDCSQGVNIEQGSNNVIVGNTITDNSGPAFATVGYVEGSLTNCGFNNLFFANYVANNAIGIRTYTFNIWHGANYTVYDNDFINNNQQAQVIVSNSTSTYENYLWQDRPWSDYWNSSEQGNYWSDYNGTSTNGDGIGDTPYYVDGSEFDYCPLMVPFNISSIQIPLPAWADVTLPSPLPMPSFPPSTLASQTPTPTSSPSATNVPATTDNGSTVDLEISGNITSSQMSNVTLATNQSDNTTTVSFTVTGESGNTGFSNMTIPKSAVPYGTTPTVYVDGQPASNQGCTQDTNNYFVWYTTSFSTHQISIVFTTTPSPSPSPTLSSSQEPFPTVTFATVFGVAAVVVVIAGLLVYSKKHKR